MPEMARRTHMKKILMIVGALAIGTVVLLIGLFAVIATVGNRLDRESKAYAEGSMIAIVTNWDENALMTRASPEFINATREQNMNAFFEQYRRLGRMTHYKGSMGDANITFWTGTGRRITAVYNAQATFENGTAEIRITLIKRGHDWRVMGFNVNGHLEPHGNSRAAMIEPAALRA